MGKNRLVQRQGQSYKHRNGPRLRMNLNQRQKMTQRRMVAISIALIIGTVSMVAFFNMGSVKYAIAGGTKKFSVADGEWSQKIWSNDSSTGTICNCDPGNNFTGLGLDIVNNVTSSVHNPLKISGGVTNIKTGGKLEVIGDFELSGGSIINIENGDSLIIHGNLSMGGASIINVSTSGYLHITGNVVLSEASKVLGPSAEASYLGTISGSGWEVGILPAQLIYFHTSQNEGAVRLSWATASERNNDYFTVERSADGSSYEEVLKSSGAGSSTSALTYSAFDNSPLNGNSYYRLKQTDTEGHYSYSKAASVSNNINSKEEEITIESVSTNPLKGNVVVNFALASKGNVEIKIFNGEGICVMNKMINSEKGSNSYLLNDSRELASGIYFINLLHNGKNAIKKVMKS